MSVVGSAHERIGARSGSEREDGSRTYRRLYLVEVNNAADGQRTVLAAGGLPYRFCGYSTWSETDLEAVVVNRNPRQIAGSRYLWEVEVEYDSKRDPDGRRSDQNPLYRLPVMSCRFESFQVHAQGTLVDGLISPEDLPFEGAILNSALEPFDPPAMVDDSRPLLTIQRNEEAFNPALALEFKDAVNQDMFFGVRPRQAKIRGIQTPGRREASVDNVTVYYYPVTYSILFKRETWDLQLLDQGSYYWSGGVGTGKKKQFTTDEGHPIVGKLDGAGGKLAEDADPVWRRFRCLKEKVFATLNLPDRML